MAAFLVEAPIALGELIDKITILEIKSERIFDASKLKNITAELALLIERRDGSSLQNDQIAEMSGRLKSINERIWDLEDAIRDCERSRQFGDNFVELARKIYKTNDERAAVKREINLASGSGIVEEKSYASY